jgi:hypothetical protein
VHGVGFIIDIQSNTLTISNSCKVVQPDKNLSANRCSWNWKNDLLTAAGYVNLKESGSDQVKRADQMQGEFNQDGSIRFSPSQNRVKTQIKLESGKNKDVNQKRPSQVQF